MPTVRAFSSPKQNHAPIVKTLHETKALLFYIEWRLYGLVTSLVMQSVYFR